MFKRAATILAVLTALAAGFFSQGVSAQKAAALQVRATREHSSGIDRVFEFDVANLADHGVTARGRVMLLSVYDASQPVTVLVPDLRLGPGGVSTVTVRWTDAPFVGQVRALLVLSDGLDPTLIQSFDFLVFPLEQGSLFVGICALFIALALAVMRLPKYLKGRVPANMLAYLVEEDDTVVTLSTRFDVTWQDIVRANRLRPPYALKAGRRILVPMHGLRRTPSEKA
jgi:hypothetical protein